MEEASWTAEWKGEVPEVTAPFYYYLGIYRDQNNSDIILLFSIKCTAQGVHTLKFQMEKKTPVCLHFSACSVLTFGRGS